MTRSRVVVSIRSFLLDHIQSDCEYLEYLARSISVPFSGFELTWGPEEIMALSQSDLDGIATLIERYRHNTLHCGGYRDRAFGESRDLMARWVSVVRFFAERELIKSVTIHSDDIGDWDIPSQFDGQLDCCAEVMGRNGRSHNRFWEIRELVDRDKGWKLTLDTAHIREMYLEGEPGLDTYLSSFEHDIGHIHFSSCDNVYRDVPGYSAFETRHALVSISPEFKRTWISPSFETLKKYPVTLEGMVPNEPLFWQAFEEELKLFGPIEV